MTTGSTMIYSDSNSEVDVVAALSAAVCNYKKHRRLSPICKWLHWSKHMKRLCKGLIIQNGLCDETKDPLLDQGLVEVRGRCCYLLLLLKR